MAVMRFGNVTFGARKQGLLRLLTLVIVAALIAGCAATDPTSGPKPWPNPPPEGYVLLLFYTERHDRLREGPTLQIDGQPLVNLPDDSYTWCYLKPGLRVIRAIWSVRLGKLNVHIRRELKAGESIFVKYDTRTHRASPSDMISGLPTYVTADVAQQAIQSCVYRPPRKQVID